MLPVQDRRTRGRAAALTALSVGLLGLGSLALGACGSSAASDGTRPASVAPAPITDDVATSTSTPAPATIGTSPTTGSLTGSDVADLERQLDEIDQLLAGVDADLGHD